MMRNRIFLVLGAALLAVSCSSNAPKETAKELKETPKDSAAAPKKDQAPDTFKAKFETTKGDFVVEVHREWAPRGADRFHELVKAGFFDGGGFFRVIKGFMVQFGLNPDPKLNAKWSAMTIPDDPVTKANTRGRITFATAGPATRTTQLFINYGNNSRLDDQGFAPFGQVVEGMDVVDNIYGGYREDPDQGMIERRGNAYLKEHYPKLDYIKKVTLL